MSDGLESLNRLDPPDARAALLGCCGSQRWAVLMERGRPYASAQEVVDHAELVFDGLDQGDWLEAFAAHARIGEPRDADPQGRGEQSGVLGASAEDRSELVARNTAYEARFGYVFLICATGLDAPASIAALEDRYANPPQVEFGVAGAEQRKITRLRLGRLLDAAPGETSGATG
ncbi:MAG TPA: 2-oxo-4-hydroxy-4-carboxy-5-ureidoimidazoline decarboxylase [Solirubrobacteraceae bacterium]